MQMNGEHRPQISPVVPAQTQLKRGAGEGQRGSDPSLTIKLMHCNCGTSGSRCVQTARIEESASMKVGGPDLICFPPTPESWNGFE